MFAILNWCFNKYVFNGDFEKIYPQIFVHPSNRQYQRLLFRKNVNEEIKDYEIYTVTFCINIFGYSAIGRRVKRKKSNKVKQKYV